MTAQLHSLKEGLEEEEQRLSDRKAELAAWEEEQEAAYNKKDSELRVREHRLDERIEAYQAEKAEFEEERSRGTLAEENKELNNQVNQFFNEKSQWSSTIHELNDKIKELKNSLEEAKATIATRDEEIGSLKFIRDDLQQDLDKERENHGDLLGDDT